MVHHYALCFIKNTVNLAAEESYVSLYDISEFLVQLCPEKNYVVQSKHPKPKINESKGVK